MFNHPVYYYISINSYYVVYLKTVPPVAIKLEYNFGFTSVDLSLEVRSRKEFAQQLQIKQNLSIFDTQRLARINLLNQVNMSLKICMRQKMHGE